MPIDPATKKAAENWLEGLLVSRTAGAVRFVRLESKGAAYSMIFEHGKQERELKLEGNVVEVIGRGSQNEQMEVQTVIMKLVSRN